MRALLGILGSYLILNLVLVLTMQRCRPEVPRRSLALAAPFEEMRPRVEAWAEESRLADDGSLEARSGQVFAILQASKQGSLLLLRSRKPALLEAAAQRFESKAATPPLEEAGR